MSRLMRFAAAGAVMCAATSAGADPGLPPTLAVTAYDVGSSGYSQAVAVGSAFKNNYGVTLRVLPGKNDVSRMVPLREGKIDFVFNGVGTYFAQEGVDVFGTPDWGPQKARLLMMSMGDNCLSVFFAGDAGVKTMADLKGKRVAFVKGSPSLQTSTLAYLRFGNLTWDDVVKVEVGGNSAGFDAVLNDQADAYFSTTNSGSILKMLNSPRGVAWPVLPPDDEAAWARVKEAAPYLGPHTCTESAGNLPPWQAASSPYPLIMMYDTGDADLAYAVTKAMFDQYPNYKDAAPAASGYALDRQILGWIVPYHEGAIRYYKEVGKWTTDHQANQEAVVARQDTLAKLWDEYVASKPASDFTAGWMEHRFEGLTEAGLKPVWRTF